MGSSTDTGRVGVAPCGHEGRYVIGTYVDCPVCDHKPTCPKCHRDTYVRLVAYPSLPSGHRWGCLALGCSDYIDNLQYWEDQERAAALRANG